MHNIESIRINIVTQRKKCNMSQAELAQKVGVTCQAVSGWERGLSVPDVVNLVRLADVFGIAIDDLLGDVRNFDADAPTDSKSNPEVFSDFFLAKEVYASGDLGAFSELVETFSPETLTKIFEIAYRDENISAVSEMVDFVAQEDLKNAALYAMEHNNVSLIAELVDNLGDENKNMLKMKAIQEKHTAILAELVE